MTRAIGSEEPQSDVSRFENCDGVVGSLRCAVSDWSTTALAWLDEHREVAAREVKSTLLAMLDWLPFKEASPHSTALLRHYVERSGEPLVIDPVPEAWQEWIQKATHGKPGRFRDLSPYNSGLFDLRNSLGHFDVEVKRNADGSHTYTITDTYQFGYFEHDTAQRGRHGFPLGALSDTELKLLRLALPGGEYENPGGFIEHWEVKTIGRETFLIIPQAFLAQQGTPFPVRATFTRR